MSRNLLYRPSPGFDVTMRVATTPFRRAIEAYEERSFADLVSSAMRDSKTSTAICVGSEKLFRAVNGCAGAETTVSERALLKAHRYIVRMATRCTPFGVFAAVAQVPIGAATDLHVDERRFEAHTRIDMGLVDRLVGDVEYDWAARATLRLYVSDFVKDRGDVLVVYRNADDKPGIRSQLVRQTRLVASVIEAAGDGISVCDLVDTIRNALATNDETANRAIDILLRSGLLVSELRADMTRSDDRTVLRKVMRHDGTRSAAIDVLLRSLDELNATPLSAQSPERYVAVRERAASALGRAEYLIQTHSTTTVHGTIGERVVRDAALMAEVLLRNQTPARVTETVRRFVSRYEGHILVPLMDLEGNPVLEGLGDPDESPTTHGFTEAGHTAFLQVVLDAIRAHHDVKVTMEQLDAWLKPAPNEELPSAVEVGFHVAARNAEAVDAGRYLVYPAMYGGSAGYGRSTGRFQHLLPQVEEKLRALYDGAGPALAEIVSIPTLARSLNLCATGRVLHYEIQIGVVDVDTPARRLSLSDLYVGVRDNRFFVWSASLEREIVPYRHDNLALVGSGSDILDFLTIAPFDGLRTSMTFRLGDATRLPHVPRVTLGRIVLSPARWSLPIDLVTSSSETLREWIVKHDMPRYVWATEKRDQRLFVDLHASAGFAQLRSIASAISSKTILCEEALESASSTWLEGAEGRYVAEFVAQLGIAHPDRSRLAAPATVPPARAERSASPADGWLYFKLYCDPLLHGHVLTELVAEVRAEARRRFGIEKWFFVRYADPNPHIRLRLYVDDPSARSMCSEYVWSAIDTALKRGVLDDAAQAVYQRELERYVGLAGLAAAEVIFTHDSEIVLSVLKWSGDRNARTYAAVETAHALLTALLTPEVIPHWLHAGDGGHAKTSSAEWAALKDIITRADDRSFTEAEAVQRAVRVIRDVTPRTEGESAFITVVNSLIHMHFNRFGISGADETRAARLLRRLVVSNAARSAGATERLGPEPRVMADATT